MCIRDSKKTGEVYWKPLPLSRSCWAPCVPAGGEKVSQHPRMPPDNDWWSIVMDRSQWLLDQRTCYEIKDGDKWCRLCGKWANDGHLASSGHLKVFAQAGNYAGIAGNTWDKIPENRWDGAPGFGFFLDNHWGRHVRKMGFRMMHYLHIGLLQGANYRLGGKGSKRYHIPREELLTEMNDLRLRGLPMTHFLRYRHEGRNNYGENGDLFPVVPLSLIPDVTHGVITTIVGCIVQIGDAGEQGIVEGWPADAEHLYFYNGENVQEWILQNMPWVLNPRNRL